MSGDERVVVHARLERILVSAGHDYLGKRPAGAVPHGVQDLPQVRCVAGRGLEGDRYFHAKPGRMGQVTFIETEAIEAIRERFGLPELAADVFRRNLVVRGVRLRELRNRRLVFQGVTFEGSQECKPCIWMDRVVATGAQKFMREPFLGGMRARVLTTGELRVDLDDGVPS